MKTSADVNAIGATELPTVRTCKNRKSNMVSDNNIWNASFVESCRISLSKNAFVPIIVNVEK